MGREDDYRKALELAMERLKHMEIVTCCKNAGLEIKAVSQDEKQIEIPYLDRSYKLIITSDKIDFDQALGTPRLPDQVTILHYLVTAQGEYIRDDWITFRQVPSGEFYYHAFRKRAIDPLVRSFGSQSELLDQVSKRMGEMVPSPGDKALKVMALPRIPIILALWEGDDEFPPEGNIYFDASISSYLPTEDIAYLAGATVYRAIAISKGW
nr:DUF3786 domain-containing protein [Desulfobacterales bacterium]